MAELELAKKLDQAIKVVSEAARLHLMLKEQSSKIVVSTALRWQFNIGGWEADQAYEYAVKLLANITK